VPSPGTGEIHANPLFINYDNNDFRLELNSPCVGAGENGKNMGAKEATGPAVNPTSFGKVKALFN